VSSGKKSATAHDVCTRSSAAVATWWTGELLVSDDDDDDDVEQLNDARPCQLPATHLSVVDTGCRPVPAVVALHVTVTTSPSRLSTAPAPSTGSAHPTAATA